MVISGSGKIERRACASLGGGAMKLHRRADRCLEAERLEIEAETTGVDARHVAQVVEDAAEDGQLPIDRCEDAICAPCLARCLEQRARVGQGAQGIAQLVAERREELVLPGCRGSRFPELVLERRHLGAQIGPVPEQLGEADLRSLAIAQGNQDAAHPHPPPILSDVPAIVLGPAQLARHLDLMDVETLGQILCQEDALQARADELGRLVAQDAGHRSIGGDDPGVEVEEDQRVVFALLMPERQQVGRGVPRQGFFPRKRLNHGAVEGKLLQPLGRRRARRAARLPA